MPELPEAEAQRRMLEKCVVGRRIASVDCREQGGGGREGLFDDKVFAEGADEAAVEAFLVGATCVGARRRGKQLWLELERAGAARALLIHLGMTGSCVVRGEAVPQYKAFRVDEASWPPRFCKLELTLDDGARVAYADPRRFGRLLLRDGDAAAAPPVSLLAADALAPPPAAAMAALLAKRHAPIKAVLLDQNAVVCGVGNWVCDDVLLAARLHPATKASDLSDGDVARLREAIVGVCETACDANADSSAFPETWLFHHRWIKQTTGSVDTPIGRVHFDTIGGRTTAFIPSVQKKGGSTPAAKKPAAKPAAESKAKPAAKKPAAKPAAKSKAKPAAKPAAAAKKKAPKRAAKAEAKPPAKKARPARKART